MTADVSIMAAVVTFNPGPDFAQNLASLRGEIKDVVVIDNGSAAAAQVEMIAVAAGCRVILNGANLGVAAALSQAAKFAQEAGAIWLATFDQDSHIQAGVIAALLRLHDRHPSREKIAILAPSHRERTGGGEYHLPFDIIDEEADWRHLRSVITSGNLVGTRVFTDVGMFDDALFIDSVDHEFCLRCRRSGYLIVQGRNQFIEHSLGYLSPRRILGLNFHLTNHSPTRRYYMMRNGLEICRRYLFFDPIWSLKSCAHLLITTVLALIYEQRRREKLVATLDGARDFLMRRFGPYTPEQ